MKHRVFAAAVLGAAAWLATSTETASAFGGRLFGGKKNDCGAPCAAPAPAADCGGCGAAAMPVCGGCGLGGGIVDGGCGTFAPAVTYTTQTVTKYVCQPTTTKQKVTTYQQQWVDVPYSWQECVVTPTTTKQKVTTYQQQWVDVPHEYQVCKPTTTMVPTQVSRTVCVPTVVARQVMVPVMTGGCGNPCGMPAATGCGSPCGGVVASGCGGCGMMTAAPTMSYACQTVNTTVMTAQTVTDTVNVPTTTYTYETVKGTHKECRIVPVDSMVDVTTYTSAMVTKNGTRKECKLVPVDSMVDVTTYTSAMVTKNGTRKECKLVPVDSMVDVTTYTMVPVTETIQVPVYTNTCGGCGMAAPAVGFGGCDTGCAPAATGCNERTGLFGGRLFGGFRGLFNRGGSCGGCN